MLKWCLGCGLSLRCPAGPGLGQRLEVASGAPVTDGTTEGGDIEVGEEVGGVGAIFDGPGSCAEGRHGMAPVSKLGQVKVLAEVVQGRRAEAPKFTLLVSVLVTLPENLSFCVRQPLERSQD